MIDTDVKVILFTKAPVAGKVKTRLIPVLGALGAVELHKRMTRHILNMLFNSGFPNIELQCHPDSQHSFFMDILDQHCVELNKQTGGDLGERMANASKKALNEHPYVVIIGSDAPVINKAYIDTAFNQLRAGTDIVLGPAEDGGYVLIGLSRFDNRIFQNIDWGTDRVFQQTLAQIKCSGLSYHELTTQWDVDVENDLGKLQSCSVLSNLLHNLP